MMATAQAKAQPKLSEPKTKKGKKNNKAVLQNGISEPKQPLESVSSSSSSDSNHNVNNPGAAAAAAAAAAASSAPQPNPGGGPENHNSYSFRNFLNSSNTGSPGGPGNASNGTLGMSDQGIAHHNKGMSAPGGEADGSQQPQHHGYPSYPPAGYPPYSRSSGGPYEQHLNSDMASVYGSSAYPPPMRFPGKPLPGPSQPGGGPSQYPGGPLPPPPQHLRGGYPSGLGHGQPPTGPTPTLNQLLQSSGGGSGASGPGGSGGNTVMTGHGHTRYPPPPPSSSYDQQQQQNSSAYPNKADYPGGPSGWPGGPPPPQSQRPPVNSYGHPQTPPQHLQHQQPQQNMYRQGSSAGQSPRPPPPQHLQPPPQQPQYYNQPPGLHHSQHGQQQYPPPPSQSPLYPAAQQPPHTAQRYPPGIGRPGESQPPSHYSGGMPGEAPVHQPPLGTSSTQDAHPPKSTPPPSPSLSQQQPQHHQMNHSQQLNPPSPQQSLRSTQQQLNPPTSISANSSNSSSHRPQGPSPNSYAPPDVGDVTGCNSNDNDSAGGLTGGGLRPSPSPTGSASSRSMSPAIGSTNIPVPPRPSSSQSDGSSSGPPRMSQSPMPGGPYPTQQPMAPPTHHHMYPTGGPGGVKLGHSGQMLPLSGGQPGHYPQQTQHWPPQQQPYSSGSGSRHGNMLGPYPATGNQLQGISPNYSSQLRHPNHAAPPQSPYGSYPPPQFAGGHPPSQPPPQWPSQGNSSQPTNSSSRSQPNQHYLKQHLAHKMSNYPSTHPGGYPTPGGNMGPPSSGIPPSSPSQTPPPQIHGGHMGPLHPPHQSSHDSSADSVENSCHPPNIISMGPDGAPVDEVSQQSTLSNASGASGDDGPAMPKLRKEGPSSHNYQNHPIQASSSPNPGSMSSVHDEYGDGSSPGWPRPPASPILNSHPAAPAEHFRSKVKKPDSMSKLYDMDDNPDRRMFLDKLLRFMEDQGSPISACPTISKNPLDLFKLYYLVKERGGFLEVSRVTKNKTWKDIAGSLGIGASSSAAYTLRKHYTKHLLPFECKFDRGGIDPQPLINQVEASTKKKGAKAAPVPSPGSSNSQDSFPGPNTNTSSSMDSFPGYTTPYGGPPAEYGGGQAPTQRPNASPGQPQPQHAGDKIVNLSNPFDDLHPANQFMHHFHQSHSNQQQGYQGQQVYSAYPPPGNDQYSRGPPPHEYPQPSYGAPTPSGYPPPPGRPHYSYGPNAQEGGASPGPPTVQQLTGPQLGGPTQDEQHQRYNMGPPPPAGYPPSHGPRPQYAPGQGPPPPPNGYPGQDYYPPEQGFPTMPSQSSGGKQLPANHPGQMRRIDYPSQGKDSSTAPPPQGYTGYPPQNAPLSQSRIQPYDAGNQSQGPRPPPVGYLYPSGTARDPGNGLPNRSSSPSSSPSTTNTPSPHPHTQSSKQWIPPEGWQSAGQYQQQQRPYGVPPQGPPTSSPGPLPPAGSQSTTPIPTSHSPVSPQVPASLSPQQSPAQPWGAPGPLGSRGQSGPLSPGPVGWNHTGSTSPSHSGIGNPIGGPQQPWTQQQSVPRSSGRPSFPSNKADIYKGYPATGPMLPPSNSSSKLNSMMSGTLVPINQPIPSMPPHSPQQIPLGPQSTQFSQPPIPTSPVQIKKEITFPLDSIEGITPVLSRRRKLHKNDVAPVEAWRIMMCLKSGLLAETTWALDILNILLYDDHSITYFSLTYLPGLLDLLLEQLRRSLILIFGQSVGLEIAGDKFDEPVQGKNSQVKRKWFERATKVDDDEVDVGTPLTKFPRDGHRTSVLHGSPNYTLKTRRGRMVKIVARDDEPFILSDTRDWDMDEKSRNNPQSIGQPNGTMEVTRHVVTSFTTDLNIVPLIRVINEDGKRDKEIVKSEMETQSAVVLPFIKIEPTSDSQSQPPVNLDMYHCETKLATEFILTSPRKLNGNPSLMEDSNSRNSSHGQEVKITANMFMHSPSNSNSGSSKGIKTVNAKTKKLEGVLSKIRRDLDNEDAMIESPLELESIVKTVTDVLANSQSDNAVMSGIEDNSNMSNNTENSSSEFGDSTPAVICGNQISARIPETSVASSDSKTCGTRSTQLKRRRLEEFEDECYTRDEPSLYLVTEAQDTLARRCLSICNVLRNLTFVPGNDVELGKSTALLSLLGKLLLLHHDHPIKGKQACSGNESTPSESNHSMERDENTDGLATPLGEIKLEESEDGMIAAAAAVAAAAEIDSESCTSLRQEDDWWWDYTHHIREHVLVMIANISGQIDLSQFSEEISRPILDGLLHWAVCPAAYGQDPFPTLGPHSNSNLSPQRLAIEAICKLSVTQGNVDLLLATPPYSRIEKFCQLLSRGLCRSEDQVLREFSVNILCYLSGADSSIARTVALQNPCISLLISFIEQAEANAMNIANNHGFSALRENPESMGTSLDMLRRAANTLLHLAKHPDNRALFVQHEPRLLNLVMSQILEQKVAAIVAQVLYQCSVSEGGNSHKGHCYTNSCDRFYTPSLSRSRSVVPPGIPTGGMPIHGTPPLLPSTRLIGNLGGSKEQGSFPFITNHSIS